MDALLLKIQAKNEPFFLINYSIDHRPCDGGRGGGLAPAPRGLLAARAHDSAAVGTQHEGRTRGRGRSGTRRLGKEKLGKKCPLHTDHERCQQGNLLPFCDTPKSVSYSSSSSAHTCSFLTRPCCLAKCIHTFLYSIISMIFSVLNVHSDIG